METNIVRLSAKIAEEIEKHSEKTYPEECCGILLGSNGIEGRTVEEIREIDNSQSENRRRRFLISSEQYLQAEKLASERKMELLGFYHSHPDHFAVPSQFDTDHALPWFTYIIVSVKNGRPGIISAWKLEEERSRFTEQLIIKEPYELKSPSCTNSQTF